MKLLITGIDGFTGRHLSSYLKDSYEIYGTSLRKEGQNIFQCDITQKESIQKVLDYLKPDFIIHLAAISFVGHANIESFYRVNALGTQNLLESIKECQKVIIASSATVYGTQNREVLDETMCPNPNNHYGISKFAAEQIAKNFFNRYNIIITRPFNYTGLYQDEAFLVPKIVKHFKEKKRAIHLGNLNVIREVNSIGFVCEVYKRLLEAKERSFITNIATSRGILLVDIIKNMEKIAGYNIKIIQNEKLIRKNEIIKLIGSKNFLESKIGKIEDISLYDLLKNIYKHSQIC